MNVGQTILNGILVSLPEEIFITYIILLLLGRYDFFAKEKYKKSFIKVMSVTTIPMAVVSNLMKMFIKDENIILLVCIILFSLLISVLHKITSLKQYPKVLLYTFIAYVIFMITELITVFIAIYTLGLTPSDFNHSAIQNFVIAVPERLMQYGFLIFVFLKKNGASQVNISNIIEENKTLKKAILAITTVTFTILIAMVKLFVFDNILASLETKYQIFIIITTFSLAILIMLTIWILVICIYPSEKYKLKYTKENLYEEEYD